MMHGYIALDRDDNLLVPFRTWRNNITGEASKALTELFGYPVPQRWSIAHLYQAVLNGEEHLPRLARLTTLAGYVHYRLTGRFVIGIDDASGMFPVDPGTGDFYDTMLDAFDGAVAERRFPWKIRDVLPKTLPAGEEGGTLTAEGARLFDGTGTIQSGIPLCPPEGDAGTGMVATNSIRVRTGNVSAGTSVFAMIVLEKPLRKVHPEIDLIVTPDGYAVAMAHSNNCTSDFDAWMALLGEAVDALGGDASPDSLYGTLMPLAVGADADADGGGLLSYGYVSGEHVTGFSEGRPLFVRKSDSRFNLANFLRTHLFAALGAMRTGLNILFDDEGVQVEEIRGHGGLFKTPGVGQRIMAAATNTPVSVMATAGEGGAWGMALLASFMIRKDRSLALPDFLDQVFSDSMSKALDPDPSDVEGFDTFFRRYTTGLAIERAAVDNL
jgi:sugar (pentulose or hexulose) kinase